MQRARRVILGEVERREVVEIVLDLRTGADTESRIAENAVNTRHRP